jgi:hypothetical protein
VSVSEEPKLMKTSGCVSPGCSPARALNVHRCFVVWQPFSVSGDHGARKIEVIYGITIFRFKKNLATRHGSMWEERRFYSYSFLISALDGGEWSASRPGRALPPGKEPPVPIG